MAGSQRRIPLARIRTDEALQMRAGPLDPQRVEYLADLARDGKQLPPVLLVKEEDVYWLVDGHYRLEAAKLRGAKDIAADVEEGTFERARWLATAVNADHGRERDSATIDRAIATALGMEPAWSNRRIADHVGSTDKRVARVRASLGLDQGERVGRDNVVRTLPAKPATEDSRKSEESREEPIPPTVAEQIAQTLRKRPGAADEVVAEWYQVEPAVVGEVREMLATEEAEEEASRHDGIDADPDQEAPEESTEGETTFPVTATSSQLAPSKSGIKPLLDGVGLEIPEGLAPCWVAVHEAAQELLSALERVQREVGRVASLPGGEAYAMALEHREVRGEGVSVEVRLTSSHLKSAVSTLKGNLPFASVCPECVRVHRQRSVAGCRVCLGRGWVPRVVWVNFLEHQRVLAVEFARDEQDNCQKARED